MCETLRRARLNAGLSQAQLAGMAGISEATVVRIESGKGYKTKRKTFVQLCSVLGLNPSDVQDASLFVSVRDSARWRRVS